MAYRRLSRILFLCVYAANTTTHDLLAVALSCLLPQSWEGILRHITGSRCCNSRSLCICDNRFLSSCLAIFCHSQRNNMCRIFSPRHLGIFTPHPSCFFSPSSLSLFHSSASFIQLLLTKISCLSLSLVSNAHWESPASSRLKWCMSEHTHTATATATATTTATGRNSFSLPN